MLALPSFVDRSHGWVAVLTSSDTYQAHTFLFRTIDGGASVRLREPPTFETSRDGFLPVEFLREERGRPRALAAGFYVTADAGATWSEATPGR